jgi:MerR family transcriptional regulator/heat shock protein HspR
MSDHSRRGGATGADAAGGNRSGGNERGGQRVDPNRVGGTPTGERRTKAVYVISVAAELAGMHPQTLRIYERRGLVSPARTQGGNRRYSDADIARLQRIAELTAEGLNLEGIRRVMALEKENAQLRADLDRARDLVRHMIADIEARQTGGELVPLRQAMAVFGEKPSIFDTPADDT